MLPLHTTIHRAVWIAADANAIAQIGSHLLVSSTHQLSSSHPTSAHTSSDHLLKRTRQLINEQFRDPEYHLPSILQRLDEEAIQQQELSSETTDQQPGHEEELTDGKVREQTPHVALPKQKTKLSGSLKGFGRASAAIRKLYMPSFSAASTVLRGKADRLRTASAAASSAMITSKPARKSLSDLKLSASSVSSSGLTSNGVKKISKGNLTDKHRARLSDGVSNSGHGQASKSKSVYDSGFEPTTFGHDFVRKRMQSQTQQNSSGLTSSSNSNGQVKSNAAYVANGHRNGNGIKAVATPILDAGQPGATNGLQQRNVHVVGSPTSYHSPSQIIANNTKHQLMKHLKNLFPTTNGAQQSSSPTMTPYPPHLPPQASMSNRVQQSNLPGMTLSYPFPLPSHPSSTSNGGHGLAPVTAQVVNGSSYPTQMPVYTHASSQRFDPSGPCLLSTASLPISYSSSIPTSGNANSLHQAMIPAHMISSATVPYASSSYNHDSQVLNRSIYADNSLTKQLQHPTQPSYRIGKGGGLFASNTTTAPTAPNAVNLHSGDHPPPSLARG
jgi:hypothetical protein